MRVKKGFINRNVCGESVLLATGQENIDFTNIISLNETANFLWNELAQREKFTIDDMVELLTGEYVIAIRNVILLFICNKNDTGAFFVVYRQQKSRR